MSNALQIKWRARENVRGAGMFPARPDEIGDDIARRERALEEIARPQSPITCQIRIGNLDPVEVSRNFSEKPGAAQFVYMCAVRQSTRVNLDAEDAVRVALVRVPITRRLG